MMCIKKEAYSNIMEKTLWSTTFIVLLMISVYFFK